MQVSVIITTYNRPKALDIALKSLQQQTHKNFEVLVADDGSEADTKAIIEKYANHISLKHIWQEDNGFQAAAIRNKAAAQTSGEYLIFMDGDIVAFPDFIEQHILLAELGWFVAGNRILLNEQLSTDWEIANNNPLSWHKFDWLKARYHQSINRLLPLIKLSPNAKWRKKSPTQWKGAKTCNLAVWKKDFIDINGFDESYQGWGHEDADLAIRLIQNKTYRKDGRFAVPVLHLWHPENSRHNEQENWQRLQHQISKTSTTWANKGVDQYL